MNSILTDLFAALAAVLKSDLRTQALPQIQQAMNLIAANPTMLNLLAQADALRANLASDVPGILQDELKALDTFVTNELQQLAAPPPPPAPAPAAGK